MLYSGTENRKTTADGTGNRKTGINKRGIIMNQFMTVYYKELNKVNDLNGKSAWARGVGEYAREITDNYDITFDGTETTDDIKKKCLNGATSWWQYANGACALAVTEDIRDRLCTESEKKSGKRPAAVIRECGRGATWIEAEAVALEYAFSRVKKAFNRAKKEMEMA